MKMKRPLLIVGAGGFGREVAWLVEEINQEAARYELIGFLDDTATETVEGYPVVASVDSWVRRPDTRVQLVCAIGDPLTRLRTIKRLSDVGARFGTLVHPSVRHSRWVEFGEGTIVCADTTVTTNVTIGSHCIINLDCTVGHDAVLGDFTSVMPGVHLSGEVRIGTGVYFGTGAAVINRVSIGAWTIIGAGAVVAKDIPERVVAVGVPARPIRENSHCPQDS